MYRLSAAAVVVAATIAFPQSALAAPPPVHGWTGWYIGLNAGGTWGGDSVSTSASNSEFCAPPTCGHALDFANASIESATGDFGASAGFIAGGQLGYNWQLADRWIAGFEADIQGLLVDAGGSKSHYSAADVVGFADHSVGSDVSVSKRIDFLGTVRGRLGYLVEPRLLVFGTGGLAYGHAKSSLAIAQNPIGNGLGSLEPRFSSTSSVSRMLFGWTLGGGFEWLLGPNWTAKVEYLYFDLGSMTTNDQIANRKVPAVPLAPYYFVNDVQSTTRVNGSIVRVGLNWHF